MRSQGAYAEIASPVQNRRFDRALAEQWIRNGELSRLRPLLYEAAVDAVSELEWLQRVASAAMRRGELALASRCLQLVAEIRWGTAIRPQTAEFVGRPLPLHPEPRFLTASKLVHDAAQFRYLQSLGVLGAEFDPVIGEYEAISRELKAGHAWRVPLDGPLYERVGAVFNLMANTRETPRLQRALSLTWDGAAIEAAYDAAPLGVVVIDNFLTADALREVRAYCLESTVWTGNRYAHGRLGAFFHDGFNCPLLIQIAEEVRGAFPNLLGNRYPLRQLWAFKNTECLPADVTTHADFAAVNVNFWITPDDANLEPDRGGLVVHGVEAPLGWGFDTYNSRSDVIRAFLRATRTEPLRIPYRQNRAIIFNSDLFHATDKVTFRPEYENHRINVTMLFGDRQNDHAHHVGATAGQGLPASRSWRSKSFSLARRMR